MEENVNQTTDIWEEIECSSENFMASLNASLVELVCSQNTYDKLYSPMNIFVYIVVLIGVVGNVALLGVILKNRPLRTTPNILVINVTVGDLMYLIVAVPSHLEGEVNVCFTQGEAACKLINAWNIVAQGVCIYSIVAVSAERYGAITQHLGRSLFRGSAKKTLFIVCIIWLLSLLLASPVYFTAKVHHGYLCTYLSHASQVAKAYVMMQLWCHYIIPLLIITVLYSRMAHTLIRSADSFRGENQPGAKQFRARRRLAIIVLFIAVFFGVFWLPYYAYNVYYHYVFSVCAKDIPDISTWRTFHYFMSLINSCFNPWIVFIMSTTHQRMLRHCILCKKPSLGHGKPHKTTNTMRSNSFMNSSKGNYTEITSTM
ncbi:bombesin receptor subtype-3-like [Asterias amurensis]|uniref:bombesin receptor subtype-3-like n=1 Tax=Asterias amurensis TaxID=7602 RepID=UPI003AB548F8